MSGDDDLGVDPLKRRLRDHVYPRQNPFPGGLVSRTETKYICTKASTLMLGKIAENPCP